MSDTMRGGLPKKPIELIRPDRLRIRDRDFHVYHNPDDRDAEVYSVEADDTEHEVIGPYRSKLSPHELRGIRMGEFPPGLTIRINYIRNYYPFDYISFSRTVRVTEMVVYWSYFYKDWEYTLNLRHWADDFAQVLRQSSRAVRVELHHDEHGVTFYVHMPLREDDECAVVVRKYAKEVQELHRKAVRSLSSNAIAAKNAPMPSKAINWQWWIKSVGVPALVAILGLAGVVLAAWIG